MRRCAGRAAKAAKGPLYLAADGEASASRRATLLGRKTSAGG